MRMINCKFIGVQPAPHPLKPFVLYNLLEEMPGYVIGSTVTAKTITELGYTIPGAEASKAATALRNTQEVMQRADG